MCVFMPRLSACSGSTTGARQPQSAQLPGLQSVMRTGSLQAEVGQTNPGSSAASQPPHGPPLQRVCLFGSLPLSLMGNLPPDSCESESHAVRPCLTSSSGSHFSLYSQKGRREINVLRNHNSSGFMSRPAWCVLYDAAQCAGEQCWVINGLLSAIGFLD